MIGMTSTSAVTALTLYQLAPPLITLQFAAFGWRMNREINHGEGGKGNWIPISAAKTNSEVVPTLRIQARARVIAAVSLGKIPGETEIPERASAAGRKRGKVQEGGTSLLRNSADMSGLRFFLRLIEADRFCFRSVLLKR